MEDLTPNNSQDGNQPANPPLSENVSGAGGSKPPEGSVGGTGTGGTQPPGSSMEGKKPMRKLINIITGAGAGLAGAALFFLIAFLLNWGGLGEGGNTNTVTVPADMPPQLSSTPVSTGTAMSTTQIYDKYADSVVQIVSTFQAPSDFFHTGQDEQGIGSGFVVSSDGYILTNAHVVTTAGSTSGGSNTTAKKVEVHFKDGKKVDASIVGFDVTGSDVAVIKVDPADLNLVPVALGDSSKVQVGEPVVAIGSPFGIYDSSLTAGVVSAINRNVESPESGFVIQDAIQTDAAINRGNSGGPLFNISGEVIGINEQIVSESGGFEGVGFAVPIDTAKRVKDEIIANGSVEYAWMGVVGQTIDEQVAADNNLPVKQGALVEQVMTDGPADKAGIKANDIITNFDGNEITKMEDVTDLLLNYHPGDKVKVTVMRDGENTDVEVELGTRPDSIQHS
jgi:S1-C subfamily serine protease